MKKALIGGLVLTAILGTKAYFSDTLVKSYIEKFDVALTAVEEVKYQSTIVDQGVFTTIRQLEFEVERGESLFVKETVSYPLLMWDISADYELDSSKGLAAKLKDKTNKIAMELALEFDPVFGGIQAESTADLSIKNNRSEFEISNLEMDIDAQFSSKTPYFIDDIEASLSIDKLHGQKRHESVTLTNLEFESNQDGAYGSSLVIFDELNVEQSKSQQIQIKGVEIGFDVNDGSTVKVSSEIKADELWVNMFGSAHKTKNLIIDMNMSGLDTDLYEKAAMTLNQAKQEVFVTQLLEQSKELELHINKMNMEGFEFSGDIIAKDVISKGLFTANANLEIEETLAKDLQVTPKLDMLIMQGFLKKQGDNYIAELEVDSETQKFLLNDKDVQKMASALGLSL